MRFEELYGKMTESVSKGHLKIKRIFMGNIFTGSLVICYLYKLLHLSVLPIKDVVAAAIDVGRDILDGVIF